MKNIKKFILGCLLILIPSLSFAGADFIPSDTDDLPEGAGGGEYSYAFFN
jgi:hypothetical protein